MKAHHSEWISGLVDGELTGWQRWRVQRHVSRCAPCAAEYRHLVHVRKMLAQNPVTAPMSDSPEFFWSKVKREIQAREGQSAAVSRPVSSLSAWLGQHRYAFVAVVTTLVVAVGAGIARRAPRQTSAPGPIVPTPVATVEHASTLIPNTVATSIQSESSDSAVIWVSGLPWTPDMNELKTQFAQLDS
jgi:anti-sigma factor RsiW